MSIYNYRIKLTIISAYHPTITVPISSASARLRSGTPTYLQVTIPDYYTYASAISARVSDADMYLYKKINNGSWRLITWVDIENLFIYIGANNKTLVLSGHRTYSNDVPVTCRISDYSYIGVINKTFIRCGINNNPEPGDRILAYPLADFVSDIVTYTINEHQANIEISG